MMSFFPTGSGLQPFNPAFNTPPMGAMPPAMPGMGMQPPVALAGPTAPTSDSFTLSEKTTTKDPKQPDLPLKHFSELNVKNVRSKGDIRGMAFDVDDTLSKFQMGNRTIPPELIQQLKTLQDSGIKLGIVTNNPDKSVTEDFQKKLSAAGIRMDAVVHADKPSAKGLQELQKDFGLQANQMMMVGDQDTDVQSGKAAGFKTAQVDWFGESKFHKSMMHQADSALLHLDKFKRMFDSDPDQPELIKAPTETPPAVEAQA